jgi:hypothetical protein
MAMKSKPYVLIKNRTGQLVSLLSFFVVFLRLQEIGPHNILVPLNKVGVKRTLKHVRISVSRHYRVGQTI